MERHQAFHSETAPRLRIGESELVHNVTGKGAVQSAGPGELVAAASKGDTEAFGELVTRYADSVYRRVAAVGGPWADCHDIVQEAFLTAFANLQKLRDAQRFEAWTCRIAENLAKGQRRRAMREVEFDEFSKHGEERRCGHVTHHPYPELRQHLRAAMANLSERHRQVLLRHYINGHSYREVAMALNCDVSTVKSRLQKARARLRNMLEDSMRNEEKSNVLELDVKTLKAMRYASRVQLSDPQRPRISGILVGNQQLVATDGRHLMVSSCDALKLEAPIILGGCQECDFMDIPGATLVVGVQQASLVVAEEERAVFDIVEEDYPSFEHLAPSEWHYRGLASCESWGELLNEIAPYLNARHPELSGYDYRPQIEVTLCANRQEVTVRTGKALGYTTNEGAAHSGSFSDALQWQYAVSMPMQVESSGDVAPSITLHLNYGYLCNVVEGLVAGQSDCVEMCIVSHLRPIVFRRLDAIGSYGLVMPLQDN